MVTEHERVGRAVKGLVTNRLENYRGGFIDYCNQLISCLTALGEYSEVSTLSEYRMTLSEIDRARSSLIFRPTQDGKKDWIRKLWKSYLSRVRDEAYDLEEKLRPPLKMEWRDDVIRIVRRLEQLETFKIFATDDRLEIYTIAGIILVDFIESAPTEQFSKYRFWVEEDLYFNKFDEEEETRDLLNGLSGLKSMLMRRSQLTFDYLRAKPEKPAPLEFKAEEVGVHLPYMDKFLRDAYLEAALSVRIQPWNDIRFNSFQFLKLAHLENLQPILDHFDAKSQAEPPPKELLSEQAPDGKYIVSYVIDNLEHLYPDGTKTLSDEHARILANKFVKAGEVLKSRAKLAEWTRESRRQLGY